MCKDEHKHPYPSGDAADRSALTFQRTFILQLRDVEATVERAGTWRDGEREDI